MISKIQNPHSLNEISQYASIKLKNDTYNENNELFEDTNNIPNFDQIYHTDQVVERYE